jgi:polyisoprenoid-binding protein YceI
VTVRSVRQVLAGFLFSLAAAAQSVPFDLDPAKTRIEFTVADLLHTVHGTFKLKSGHFEVDPGNRTLSGEAVVEAASGESGSVARDGRMKRNILEADKYPEISFTATGFTGTILTRGPSSVTVTGWFFIHGEKHPVSIPMQVKLASGEVSANGHLVIPYVAWGMKNPSTFVLRVNDKVAVEIFAVGPLSNGTAFFR